MTESTNGPVDGAVRVEVSGLPVEVHVSDDRIRQEVVALCRGFLTQRPPIAELMLELGDPDEWSPPAPSAPDCTRLTPPGLSICAEKSFERVYACLDPQDLYWSVRAALRTVFYNLVSLHHGMPLHAGGIVKQNRAYVFVGPSGSGKTTIARLSCPYLVLDDDLVFVRKSDGRFAAYSTPPWSRTIQGLDEPARFGLAGVYCLRHGARPVLKRLEPALAAARILSSPPGATQEVWNALLAVCDELTQEVPCFELTFAPDRRFWELIDCER